MAIPDRERHLDPAALAALLEPGSGWRPDGSALTKTFRLAGFKAAVAFVNRIAAAAEAANHHPDIHLEGYRNVRIVLTTHVAHGLTDADIDLARRIDALAVSPTP